MKRARWSITRKTYSAASRPRVSVSVALRRVLSTRRALCTNNMYAMRESGMTRVRKRGQAKKAKKAPSPAPKVGASQVSPHPQPRDPQHAEWTIDEAEDESFPASDPSSITQPHKRRR